MNNLKRVTIIASGVVFAICIYSFLLGNEVFQGHFRNDPISWYILAKGIFCSLTLYLIVLIIEFIKKVK